MSTIEQQIDAAFRNELAEARDRYERLAYRARAVVSEFERRDLWAHPRMERMEQAVANLEVELAQGDLGAPRSPLAEAVDEVVGLRARCERLETILALASELAIRVGDGHPPHSGLAVRLHNCIQAAALGAARPTMATEARSNGVAQDLASEEGVS